MNEPLVRLKIAVEKIKEAGGFTSEYAVREAQANRATRRKLLEEGALIPGAGPLPNLYRPMRLMEVMNDLASRRATDELARMETAA